MNLAKVLALCVICTLVVSIAVTACASDDTTSLMDDLLNADVNESMEFGETVCLADILGFSIPSDWESVPEAELDERLSFQYNCTDGDGRKAMFVGLTLDSALSSAAGMSSYMDIKERLTASKTRYIAAQINGIDVIFSGEAVAAAGAVLTQEGDLLQFTFGFEPNEKSSDEQSKKLIGDMAAILHSVKCLDTDKLMKLEDNTLEEKQTAK